MTDDTAAVLPQIRAASEVVSVLATTRVRQIVHIFQQTQGLSFRGRDPLVDELVVRAAFALSRRDEHLLNRTRALFRPLLVLVCVVVDHRRHPFQFLESR